MGRDGTTRPVLKQVEHLRARCESFQHAAELYTITARYKTVTAYCKTLRFRPVANG